ncbi:exo-alpha-sialidase [Spirosoma sp. BT702]|uniref:exo-alpha-sialidase n=1 Tax=Spirosoma profusum TaxID=2771354 RepID=A0A926Y396_9BACT|nr:sialidase family protein [Spirosoma profusum]MBD2703832.1 exo-alpha-sialidase [Spirosoma profusum]
MKYFLSFLTIGTLLLSGCRTAKNTAGPSQEPVFEITATVFDPGTTYATTRIPALVMTAKGTLLAFCEARVNNTGDWADIDIVMRRSTDGGKTWEDNVVIAARENKRPTSNCTPIVDRDGKTIHVLYQRNYSNCFYVRSTDDGKTWSAPSDITNAFEQFRPEYNWKVLAPGPGHAIQLQKGAHAGRLVVPVWLCEPNPKIPGGDHRPSCIATVYSDDLGKTWKRGDIITNTTAEIKNPSEHVAIETTDGRVMLNIRTESEPHRRMVAYSADGATGWTKPAFDDELFDPVCMASLIRVSSTDKGGKSRIAFVNPDSENDPEPMNNRGNRKRQNLTVKLSYDDGQSWPVKKVIDPGKAGYSDLAVGPDGMIYCLYETNEAEKQSWRYRVVLKRFNLAWLTDQKDTGNVATLTK